MSNTLNRTLDRHPCSDTLTRPASMEAGLSVQSPIRRQINPPILRTNRKYKIKVWAYEKRTTFVTLFYRGSPRRHGGCLVVLLDPPSRLCYRFPHESAHSGRSQQACACTNPKSDISSVQLTLEVFFPTAAHSYAALEELRESVNYWRRAIPADGLDLQEALELATKNT